MTKRELLDVIKDKQSIIALLNEKIDQLELAAIASDAKPMTAEDSRVLASLLAQIRDLKGEDETTPDDHV